MDFKEFESKTIEYFKEKYEDKYQIMVRDVLKNNGEVLRGITMIKDDINASPTIYLNDMYRALLAGNDFDYIMHEIDFILEKSSLKDAIDISFLSNYDTVKTMVLPKLINKEMNEDYLKDVPHFEFLDLAVSFYVIVENETFGAGSIAISNSNLEEWNITKEEMLEEALKNYDRLLGCTVEKIESVLLKMLKERGVGKDEDFPYLTEKDGLFNALPMYVVSNRKRTLGAASLLDKKKLKMISKEFSSSLYILPSSIHELIFIPSNVVDDIDYLKSMVSEVNKTEVSKSEFLSNSVYYYDAEKSALSVA